jgi:hypothetical protein
MKIRLTLLMMVLSAQLSWAQQWPFEMWHDGKIVLETGDTLRGQVKYDIQQDLVQFNDQQGVTEAFTPRKVLYFEIFDQTISRYRSFYALPYAAAGSYRTLIFFELLVEGKMTLLSREALEYRTFSSPFYYGSYTRLVLVYKYFLMEETGTIREFTGKKGDLLSLMGRKADEVDRYIKSNRLKIEDRFDFARTVAYYNSLFGS